MAEDDDDITDYGSGGDYPDTPVILDSAPAHRPNDWARRRRGRGAGGAGGCLVHSVRWEARVGAVVELVRRAATLAPPDGQLSLYHQLGLARIEKDICCCAGADADRDSNMPWRLLSRRVCHLHLFFQNALNQLQATDDDPLLAQLRNTLAEILQEAVAFHDGHRLALLTWIQRVVLLALANIVSAGSQHGSPPPDAHTPPVRLETQCSS